jgi:hypothetical protein
MTPREFKAWFEGFTEAFDRIPSKAQWARIKERVAEIDGNSVTERVYIDRYWNLYNQGLQPSWRYLTTNTSAAGCGSLNASNATSYNSLAAMNSLGRSEAQSLAAERT